MLKEWFLGSRKFIIMLLLIIVSIIFRICELITGTDLVTLLSSTSVAFMGANTAEHMFGAVKDWIGSKKKDSEAGDA